MLDAYSERAKLFMPRACLGTTNRSLPPIETKIGPFDVQYVSSVKKCRGNFEKMRIKVVEGNAERTSERIGVAPEIALLGGRSSG